MLVSFDNGTPRTLARYLIGRHTVTKLAPADGTNWEMASFCRRRRPRGDCGGSLETEREFSGLSAQQIVEARN